MNNVNPRKIRFIGMAIPAGIPKNDKNELIVSVCFNINKYAADFADSEDKSSNRYHDFINSLIAFQDNNLAIQFNADKVALPAEPTAPFEHFMKNDIKMTAKQYQSIKDDLWAKIFQTSRDTVSGKSYFSKGKSIHPESTVKTENHPKPKMLVEDSDYEYLRAFDFNVTKNLAKLSKITEIKSGVMHKLDLIHQFAADRAPVANKEAQAFFVRQKMNTLLEKLSKSKKASLEKELNINPQKAYTKLYVEASDEIEIDEIVHSFSKIADDPILARLMGLTIDYKLNLTSIPAGNFFTLSATSIKDDLYFLKTPITVISNAAKSKWAYLVNNPAKKNLYFEKSILKKEHVGFQTTDLVSQVLKQDNHTQKAKRGESINLSDTLDDLTRGIILTHEKLDEIIQPLEIVNDINAPTQFTDSALTDEYFVRGHRVYISYLNEEKFYPLTNRSVRISYLGNNFYANKQVDSCLNFDAPMSYMQEDGQIKSATSNAMFEYSGELLTLKTAFAKSQVMSKKEYIADSVNHNDDGGLSKMEERWQSLMNFYVYPARKAKIEDQQKYLFFYDIPKFTAPENFPKLRFHKQYEFLINQEYLNGWGLPLDKLNASPIQLTLADILREGQETIKMDAPFLPAENKKAPMIVHQRKVSKEFSDGILEKPSLEHLVVRSDTPSDPRPFIDKRSVVLPKINLETAFFYGLLSPDKLSAEKSFDLKTRSNCPYTDEAHRNSDVGKNGKKKRCTECKKLGYCGGTQLKEYYPKKSFLPPFITDPTITGLQVRLFWKWDADESRCTPVNGVNPQQMVFEGEPGIGRKSYLLEAKGAKSETFMKDQPSENSFIFNLKKGAQLYAELTNMLDKGEPRNLINGIALLQLNKVVAKNKVLDLLKQKSKETTLTDTEKQIVKLKNAPKIIRLTHAVKEPLVMPRILKLFSTSNDRKHIEHIENWLGLKAYQPYKIGLNVIANRVNRDDPSKPEIDSSHTQVELSAHFERLDAMEKINFLKEVIPTGGLELWMRKEEYIDDPEQAVLTAGSANNHLPDQPVVDFSDPKNVFNLDHKIEFSNEMMAQLKDIKNVQDINHVDDVFRSLITKIKLAYDFKTRKFEERQYYLKNLSKFRGFFTNEALPDLADQKMLEKLEEFSLPKIKDVMTSIKQRKNGLLFSIITLNNSQPAKPVVAFAVTTIQETRSLPSKKKTVAIQKGNIVTIYLKRGRLSSGKDERVGLLVDAHSLYNKLLKDSGMLSKAGKDLVSDRYANRNQYLQYGDVVIPKNNEYSVGYDNELGMYHFLPKFDIAKQLWKFEVELDIKTQNGKQLHNPFINFSLVHFQPFSINYNDKTSDASLLDIKKDCRISEVENSVWCYLLPERKLSVYFDKPNWLFDRFGEVDLTVSFDHESLHHFNSNINEWKIRSNFIVSIQGSTSGQPFDWHPVDSWVDNGKTTPMDSKPHHPLLCENVLDQKQNMARLKLKFTKWAKPGSTGHSAKYTHFRVRFIEVEWFKNETWEALMTRYENQQPKLLDTDVVDNEEMRVRFVELIY